VPDLEGLLQRLLEHRVRFVVIGGFAAVAHGVSLLTQDVDICCPFTVSNLLRLQEALAAIHPVHRMTPMALPLQLDRRSAKNFKSLYLKTDLGELDCLSAVAGLGGYPEVKRASRRVRLGSRYCYILGLEGLIRAKVSLGRPRDREAVRQLKAIQERQSGRRPRRDERS
jgi:hypothetical protein